MTITNGYATLTEFKYWASARGETASTSANDDTMIEDIIEAVSRYIDSVAGRRFWVDTNDVVRYYTPEASNVLFIDDMASVTSIATDPDGARTWATTLSSSDYALSPANASTDNHPYTTLEMQWDSSESFPLYNRAVKITGKFGFPAVPDDIKVACLMVAHNIYQSKSGQSNQGNVSVTAAGVVIRPQDVPEIAAQIIAKYRRWV